MAGSPRRYNVVTPFGKLFDPFSDAFSRFILFLGFYAIGAAQLWMIIGIFMRDSSISFFRSVAAVRGVVVAARFSGKAKAVVQGVGTQLIFVCLLIEAFGPGLGTFADLPVWIMGVIAVATLASLVDYFFGVLPLLRAAWNEEGA